MIITVRAFNETVVPNVLQTWILLVVHLSALPMSIVVAVAQLHDTLDLHTYNVLKEFSNPVIIIAIFLKTLFWNTTTTTSKSHLSKVPVPEHVIVEQQPTANN